MDNMCLPYQSRGQGGLCLFQQPVEMSPPAHLLPLVVRSQQVWEVKILFGGKGNRRERWIISHRWIPKPLLRLSQQRRRKVRAPQCPCRRTWGSTWEVYVCAGGWSWQGVWGVDLISWKRSWEGTRLWAQETSCRANGKFCPKGYQFLTLAWNREHPWKDLRCKKLLFSTLCQKHSQAF